MKRFRKKFTFTALCLGVGLVVFGVSYTLLGQGPEGDTDSGGTVGGVDDGEKGKKPTPGVPEEMLPGDETPGPVGQVDELTLAMANGSVDDLKALLTSGTDPNHFMTFGEAQMPTLSAAVSSSRAVETAFSLTKVLIEAGANVNLPDARGWTPLHWAAIDAPDSIVTLLLKAGADPQIQNNRGKTAYEMALAFGNRAAVAAIEQHSTTRHPQRDELFIRGLESKIEAENSRKGGQR
ncbi:MAG: ankyrin repeat domain-containing protein [Acidobacteria bacterium]|nr:ankyrin repeat domain-containing protein [Acidobacteriota bacterium]